MITRRTFVAAAAASAVVAGMPGAALAAAPEKMAPYGGPLVGFGLRSLICMGRGFVNPEGVRRVIVSQREMELLRADAEDALFELFRASFIRVDPYQSGAHALADMDIMRAVASDFLARGKFTVMPDWMWEREARWYAVTPWLEPAPQGMYRLTWFEPLGDGAWKKRYDMDEVVRREIQLPIYGWAS